MTPNHPIPPERIRAEAERVVNEFAAKNTRMAAFDSMVWDDRCRERFLALVAAGASLVDVSAVQREAASRAWDARSRWGLGDDSEREKLSVAERDRYLATTHPAPAPRECVLSDGSVVTVHDGMFKRYGSTVGHITTRNWRDLADTGADFDALKQFAERAK